MLEIKDLSKRYGDVVALDGASFTARPGPARRLPGPNGAGKTTTMRCIFGLARPDRGEVPGAARRSTGRRASASATCPSSAASTRGCGSASSSSYFAQHHGLPAADADAATARWLERLGLADRAGSKLEALSHGNQQRVQLGAALVHDPELLVLDEPFCGLDPIGIATMSEILRERAAAGVGGRVLQPPARPRRGHLRGRRDHRPRPDRRRTARSTSCGRRRAAAISRSRSRAPAAAWLDGRPDLTVVEREGRPRPAPRRRPTSTSPGCWRRHPPPDRPPLRVPAAGPVGAVHGGRPVMSRRRAIWLVARREILERGRSRAFLLSLGPVRRRSSSPASSCRELIGGGPGRRQQLGIVGTPPAGFADSLAAVAKRPASTVTIGAGARRRDRRGRGSRRLARRPSSSSRPTAATPSLVVKRRAAMRASSQLARDQLHAGRRPDPALTLRELEPSDPNRDTSFIFANVGVILLFISIFTFGTWVLTGRRRGEAEPRRRGRPLDDRSRATCCRQGPRDRPARAGPARR